MKNPKLIRPSGIVATSGKARVAVLVQAVAAVVVAVLNSGWDGNATTLAITALVTAVLTYATADRVPEGSELEFEDGERAEL